MKFGKVLQQSMQMSSSSWEPHWVDYKQLKHIIKDCAHIQKEEKLQGDKLVKTKIKPSAKEDNDSIRKSPDEMNFFRTLRVEIKKIADFFVQEQAKHTSLVAAIEQLSNELKLAPKPETKTELMKKCVTLYKELLLLENFAVMNFCGISKILKKHDKWTGYATRHKFMHTILMKQPFATYVPLLQMIDRLEHIFMEATGSSIEQHDAQSERRGSGGAGGAFSNGGSRGSGSRGSGSSSNQNSNGHSSTSYHTPGNSPPPAPTGGSGGGGYEGYSAGGDQRLRDLSPRSEDSVPLTEVQSLRGDARQLKQLESVGDYDGDEDDDGEDEEEEDDNECASSAVTSQAAPQAKSRQQSSSVVAGDKKKMAPGCVRGTVQLRAFGTGNHSDSDAAAIAMLSMKESLLGGSGVSSNSGANSEPDGRRFKRKAYAPLAGVGATGKRKMSFATILN
ncbi:hypothetical protein PybrP1_007749 [[Pythium] brassicae (nom. inval.)]|nr:hypothetical protein PybrP1_007749 [[Pythium] brassicae (nom. inval.)]